VNAWNRRGSPDRRPTRSRGGPAHIAMEIDMTRELRTEQELMQIVSRALADNPDTTGWSPTAIQEHIEDEGGCNWDIDYLHGDSKSANVKEIVMPAASKVINDLRSRYNLL
jgi:hypothetical protein